MLQDQILEIEKAIRLYLEDYLNFIFTRKDKLQRSKSGKLKQFQSMLK
jgi:phenylacetate-CoA ligase